MFLKTSRFGPFISKRCHVIVKAQKYRRSIVVYAVCPILKKKTQRTHGSHLRKIGFDLFLFTMDLLSTVHVLNIIVNPSIPSFTGPWPTNFKKKRKEKEGGEDPHIEYPNHTKIAIKWGGKSKRLIYQFIHARLGKVKTDF